MKEFIFSYLHREVEGACLLDLFSGTGSLGIEALSRGAARIVFIEKDPMHLGILRRNLELCDLSGHAEIIRGDVFHQMIRLGKSGKRFDIILADPPFKGMFRSRIVECVSRAGLLGEAGLLLIEHEAHDDAAVATSLGLIKQRQFGHCVVSIYA